MDQKVNLPLAVAMIFTTFQADASIGKADVYSWGKAGVSFDNYRRDAVECGRLAANADISDERAARNIFRGIDRQDTDIVEGISSETAREFMLTAKRARFKENVETVQSTMVNMNGSCLSSRGYQRFRYTDSQMRRLAAMPRGSRARFVHAHSIASSPERLRRQVVKSD